MRTIAVALAAAVLTGAAAAAHAASPSAFLRSRQVASGGFAERGRAPTPGLTAWVVLALRASRAQVPPKTLQYLRDHEDELESATDVELVVAAESVLGGASPKLVARLRAYERPSGSIGDAINSTVWGVIALRQAGESVPKRTIQYLLGRQRASGGWGWSEASAPDTNDTAAAIEALAATGVRGAPIKRGLAFLRRHQNRDGGFALSRGWASDSESTAWAVQAYIAADVRPPATALRFLAKMRRPDGSYRHTARYATTPVWVTAQTLPAVSRRAFPLQ